MLRLRSEQGQDLTEYALLIALIVILAVAAIVLLGTRIQNVLSTIASILADVAANGQLTPTIQPTPTTCCDQ